MLWKWLQKKKKTKRKKYRQNRIFINNIFISQSGEHAASLSVAEQVSKPLLVLMFKSFNFEQRFSKGNLIFNSFCYLCNVFVHSVSNIEMGTENIFYIV